MSETIIRAENLGKKYVIQRGRAKRADTFRDAVMAGVRALGSCLRHPWQGNGSSKHEDFWALKNVNFEVKCGEVVGVIGCNGAGKSTLLKILSRITEPTTGRVTIDGRVVSLLEVGTGFHPELTGRENIFLNGAIVGMSRAEIVRKFDEIVAFAEVERFVDTSVKHYSSGMYVRLAFAVSAFLDADMMIIDEVLAVGDTAFQMKCLEKIMQLTNSGRAVILVSHNIQSVRMLCRHAMLISHGRVLEIGDTNKVIGKYLTQQNPNEQGHRRVRVFEDSRSTNHEFFCQRVELSDMSGTPTNRFRHGQQFRLNLQFAGATAFEDYSVEFYIRDESGQLVTVGASGPHHNKYFKRNLRNVVAEIGPIPFTNGKYYVSTSIVAGGHRTDVWDCPVWFDVAECNPFGTQREIRGPGEGMCVVPHSFFSVT